MPPIAPTRFGGADGLSFGEFPGDEDVAVALYVAEPSVTQGIRRYSSGQVQVAPQLHHLCRRTEAGRARVLLPEPLPRGPAGAAQLIRDEPLFRGVPGQFVGEPIPAVRVQPFGLLSAVTRDRA